jgi:hypothetical protein
LHGSGRQRAFFLVGREPRAAVLAWLMALAAAALTVAFTLTWRAPVPGALVSWAAR